MKILLLGANGQVGWELQRSLAPLGELRSCDRQTGDLEDLPALQALLLRERPTVIVNAAAYTAVDKAETEAARAQLINAEAVAVLARYAAANNAWLVHYSTDYVFAGSGTRQWCEDDATGPLNVYGHSKLAGEQAIQSSGCQHLIFRTSWVYGARGSNFAKTMLRLAAEREQLKVIADQFGAPTGAELLADITAHAIRKATADPEVSGLYHLAAAGEVSWHGFASFVIAQARAAGKALAVQSIEAIPASAYPTPAQRPLNSRLNCQKLQNAFGLQLPDWQNGVTRMLLES